MSLARLLLTGASRFDPRSLFGSGAVGWAHWYDSPSDYPGGNHPYLYQDSAGTTPVTAVGQSVGLILDRAYWGMRGAEVWNNESPAFLGEASQVSPGVYRIYSSAGVNSAVSCGTVVVGRLYEVTFSVDSITTLGTGVTVGDTGATFTTTGNKRSVWIATVTTAFVKRAGGATDIQISNISVREIPGTHRIQASAPSRPLLMARVNLFTYSEQFDNAAWAKTNSTITANAVAAPNGTTTADKLVENTANSTHQVSQIYSGAVAGSTYVFSVDLLAGERTSATVILTDNATGDGRVIVDLSAGTVGTPSVSGNWSNPIATITSSGGGWYRVKLTLTKSGGGNSNAVGVVALYNGSTTYLGDGSSGAYVWGADLRTADDASKNLPAYQRVGATAADHDTAGFPHAAYPDGTDDFDTTSTGGGGTSGFFFCGVLTVSGGAGTDRTIWSDTGTNTGYRVRINASNKLELAAGNGSAYTTVESNETITAPGTYLLSAWDDGGVLAVQVGNAAAATTARPAVSAGTSTITSYRDNGAASSYFNGRDYGSVYRQSYPGETAHNRLKAWQARRAGITV